jgi:hypothetical protein
MILNIITALNISGLALEFVGFILYLRAIRPINARPAGFTSPFDEAENVMSTIHPIVNKISIVLVGLGLGFQILATIITQFP